MTGSPTDADAKAAPFGSTREPLPPALPSRDAHLLTAAAAEGRFALQKCGECGTFCYPARAACPTCLSADLTITDAPKGGRIVSETTIRVPSEIYFSERAPWRIGLVALDCGPLMVAHLHSTCADGDRTLLSFQIDRAGQAVAFARPTTSLPQAAEDRQWQEMTADPKGRKILVTTAATPVGRATAIALAAAGATVFAGVPDPAEPVDAGLADNSAITLVPLAAGDDASVFDLAGDLGGEIDILVHPAEGLVPGRLLDGVAGPGAGEAGPSEFARLARAFGSAMCRRRRGDHPVAWVNIFSVYALANWTPYGLSASAQAACLSLSHALRAELAPSGIRTINLFTGPTDTLAFETASPPKVTPSFLANAVVAALRNGLEEVFVGDVAKDIAERARTNPKALERELGSGG